MATAEILGTLTFEDGRVMELVEVKDDVIRIRKAGDDKVYVLRKSADKYAEVEEQVLDIVNKANLDTVEDVEDEAEIVDEPKKPTKKQAKKAKAEVEEAAEPVEDEAPAVEEKPTKKASKKTDEPEEEAEEPKSKKPAKKSKPKLEVNKAELYNFDETDSFMKANEDFLEKVKKADEAAVILFKADKETAGAIGLMLLGDKYMDNLELDLEALKAVSAEVDRPKATNFKAVADIMIALGTGAEVEDAAKKLAELVSVDIEKSIFAMFDGKFSKKEFGKLPKIYSNLVEIADDICAKFL